ncbi:Crp/Fnr family transcriptional regulator [Planomonospora corallina]|uniref:Crp/Fnr family transcriptional regulator n=1 Tax=Planomonospora corallina TaxID=1806052 RepID=A0ABV8I4R8_9ACTN
MHRPAHTRAAAHWACGTLMADLSPTAGGALLGLGSVRRCAPGTVLIRQGDRDDRRVHLLQAMGPSRPACAKVTLASENGTEVLLGIRLSGDLVGELAALHDTPRSATVTVCSPSLVHSIPADRFNAFVDRHPEAGRAITRMVAQRLDWSNRRRLDLAEGTVAERLARVLTELVDRHGSPGRDGHLLGVPLSQPELGRLVAAGPDAVGKAVARLKAHGLIRSGYRGVTVLDLEALRKYEDIRKNTQIHK